MHYTSDYLLLTLYYLDMLSLFFFITFLSIVFFDCPFFQTIIFFNSRFVKTVITQQKYAG
jgi:hypothetical protein